MNDDHSQRDKVLDYESPLTTSRNRLRATLWGFAVANGVSLAALVSPRVFQRFDWQLDRTIWGLCAAIFLGTFAGIIALMCASWNRQERVALPIVLYVALVGGALLFFGCALLMFVVAV